jgi:hypothetical protein
VKQKFLRLWKLNCSLIEAGIDRLLKLLIKSIVAPAMFVTVGCIQTVYCLKIIAVIKLFLRVLKFVAC